MSIQKANTVQVGDNTAQQHKESLDLGGLDDLFQWASEVVADGKESVAAAARERKIRQHVFEVIQTHRERQARAEAQDEITYLQRRVIALLAKIQEVLEENATIKEIMVTQAFSLERIPKLEHEVKRLKIAELEKEAAVAERRILMDSIAKVRIERNYLNEVLVESEKENSRLAELLSQVRVELNKHQQKKWWHLFLPIR